jgi:hypothetical protein
VATVRAPSTGVAACALGRWTLDGSSWSRLLGGIAAAEGVGGSVAPGAVTGDATMEVTADRLTTTYRNWTFRFQAAGATVSITLDGTEVAAGGFRADGTMSFTDIADAVTVSATATADGTTIAIPSTPRSAGLGSGAGTFACGSGRLTMQIADGLPPLVLVRPA